MSDPRIPTPLTARWFWRRSESGAPIQKPWEKFSIPAQLVDACIQRDPPSASPFRTSADLVIVIGGDLFGSVRVLDVFLKNGIKYVVRRQRVTVFLIGTQFRRRRFLEAGLRNYRALREFT